VGRICATALAALAIGACPAAAASTSPAAQLAISPQPGTLDASPQTQISILGVAPKLIESVAVTGSTSGKHVGHLRAYSGDRGASFVPSTPFSDSEQVSVVIRIRGLAAKHFSFTIEHPGATLPFLSIDKSQPSKLQKFVSEPGLTPPKITVLKRNPGLAGDMFLTPLPSPVVHPGSNNAITIAPVGPGGPLIINSRGQLVWFEQMVRPMVAANLMIQRYRGQRVLTWWQGGVTPAAYGRGEGVIANSSYRAITTVNAGNGYFMDIHEFRLTPDGDAMFTIYAPIMVHLAGTPAGKLSPLLDAIVQEVDVRTGLVTWEWHSYGHIQLKDSYATPANSAFYDAYHINAIAPLANDRVLISARDTSSIYELDRVGGRIIWTLGGRDSSFHLGPGARFWFQHDVGMLPNGNITLFDDEAGPPAKAPRSRGLVLALNLHRHTAAVVKQFHRPGKTSAESEGSFEQIPGGNVFLGFGAEPYFSEFSPSGALLFDARLPINDGSYREFRYDWTATPTTRPAVVARRIGGGRVAVYVSWNGATNVVRWQVRTGSKSTRVPDSGFETSFDVKTSQRTIIVQAIDARGRVLRASKPVPVS
jgi:hypothetical protein